ncbi:MAG: hypothetical protein HW413_292 [Thermoleophilia bacterium]|nr:hypothetical protein [Thermoleophilia bacterium]
MSGDTDVARGHLDGMPFFAVQAAQPAYAGIYFRVGRADETAATTGITHLIEHLVMPASSYPDVECNGTVENVCTTVWASGSMANVGRFLHEVVSRVNALPLERLDVERRILTAEQDTRSLTSLQQAIALRFGPVAHGLTGYAEYGVKRVTEDEIAAWTAERFTAGNAVIWATDPALELDASLPPGSRVPVPEPRPIDYVDYPSVYISEAGGVLLSMLVSRSYAFGIGRAVLERRLRDRVRYELGLSYDVSIDSMPLTAEHSLAWVSADVSEASLERWCEETLRVFDELADHGPTNTELESEKMRARQDDLDTSPVRWAGWLTWTAEEHLLGKPYKSRDESSRAYEEVTSGQVAEAMQEARSSLLLVGPEGTPVPPGFAEYPIYSTHRVSGHRHRPRSRRDRLRRYLRDVELISSPEGVTSARTGSIVTARYESTVLCIREPGTRTLLTDDGFFLPIAADDWTHGDELLQEIDGAIPSKLVVSETPGLDARADAVTQLARATFRRTWLISDELEALPHVLEDGELLLVLASASRGWKMGLIALTDRRLHFLYVDGTSHSFVAERGRTPARAEGSKLKLFVDDDWISLTDVEPKGKAAELGQLLHDWNT